MKRRRNLTWGDERDDPAPFANGDTEVTKFTYSRVLVGVRGRDVFVTMDMENGWAFEYLNVDQARQLARWLTAAADKIQRGVNERQIANDANG